MVSSARDVFGCVLQRPEPGATSATPRGLRPNALSSLMTAGRNETERVGEDSVQSGGDLDRVQRTERPRGHADYRTGKCSLKDFRTGGRHDCMNCDHHIVASGSTVPLRSWLDAQSERSRLTSLNCRNSALTAVCLFATTRVAAVHGSYPSRVTRTALEPAASAASTNGVVPIRRPLMNPDAPAGRERTVSEPRNCGGAVVAARTAAACGRGGEGFRGDSLRARCGVTVRRTEGVIPAPLVATAASIGGVGGVGVGVET